MMRRSHFTRQPRVPRAKRRAAFSAASNLEFDASVERVAQIVGAGPHQIFPEAHTDRLQPTRCVGSLRLDPALNRHSALRGKPFIELLASRATRVTDDRQAHAGSGNFARDEAQPSIVW